MQPLSGLHIASLINQTQYEVELHHEDWHGPYPTDSVASYDIVFLTGLQADFDRMRQLSYHFRRNGAVVIAGGSICTLFPAFASKFFDVVCSGGVESVPIVISDFESGKLQRIYYSPSWQIANNHVDYSFFRRFGINPPCHLIEASRGCSFRCRFCVIPAENAKHAAYELESIKQAINSAVESSPLLSFRRWIPTIFFLDNNFSDNKEHMLKVARILKLDRRIKAWGALVTQDLLHNHELIQNLGRSKCRMLFIGLESTDRDFLRRYNKKQNLSRRGDIFDDILYAERNGVAVSYGYLFDPRIMSVSEMETQVSAIVQNSGFPLPTYFSLVAPLLGTAAFWSDAENGELATNLRLRDLEGETIAYRGLRDSPEAVSAFVEQLFRYPWTYSTRKKLFVSTLRRLWNSRSRGLLHWYVIAAANLHSITWSRSLYTQRKTYLAGESVLDPQYNEYPPGISRSDWETYFRPIQITDDLGNLLEWIAAYAPPERKEVGLSQTNELSATSTPTVRTSLSEA